MQQVGYRSSLNGYPKRPVHGVRGIGSPQTPLPRGMMGASPGGAGFGGISTNSRVQPTGWLLGRRLLNTPVQPKLADPLARAGMSGATLAALEYGMGSLGASWLTQGVALAIAGEVVSRALQSDSPADEAEELAKTIEAARKISNPFANGGFIGADKTIVIDRGSPDPTAGLGRLGSMRENYRRLGLPPGLGQTGLTHAGINTGLTISSTALASGSSLASSSTWLAAAGGPIGIGVAAAAAGLTYLLTRQRPARKVATTEIVNEVEPILQQNLQSYMSGPRTPDSQAQALANFDAGWGFVAQYCGDPAMGKPGEWCISDRKRGGKWDWFTRYRDPISADTRPQEILAEAQAQYGGQAVTNTTTGQSALLGAGGNPDSQSDGGIGLLVLLGLGVAAFMAT